MARKISKASLDQLAAESSARVIPKRKAAPKPQEPVAKAAPVPTADNSDIISALAEQNKQLIQAIKNIDVRPVAQAPTEKPRVKTIHIGNIERNGQNRIESADMNVTYESDA